MEVDASSQRTDLLFESFNKCLSYGLKNPSLQEFAVWFPDMPEPVVEALQDLYRQVLLNIEANSKMSKGHGLGRHSIDGDVSKMSKGHGLEGDNSIDGAASKMSKGHGLEGANSQTDGMAYVQAAETEACISAQEAELAFLHASLAKASLDKVAAPLE
eukprot:gene8904-3791_t